MSPALAAISRYQAVQVTTCTPGKLLLMLYDGLFRFLGEAKTALETNNRAKAGERISRSHAIIEQFLGGLDVAQYPELCATLEPLYLYCMQQLVEANVRREPHRIDDVIRILSPLREAWVTAVEQASAEEKKAK